MAKFGLFDSSHKAPLQEYEGDYMQQNGEHVTIFVRTSDPSQLDEQVNAIRLDKGQSVKKIGN